MKIARFAVAALISLAVLAPHLFSQDKPNSGLKTAPATLKINVVIAEMEGEKKVANLPYTFFVRAGEGGGASPWTKLRVGSRVAVPTGSFQATSGGDANAANAPHVNTQYQYNDVGTNIDGRAVTAENGQFDLSLNLERSWIESDVHLQGSTVTHEFRQPVIQQFKTELNLTMHDGQTIQSTQATDPVSGRVLTITVTMNVAK